MGSAVRLTGWISDALAVISCQRDAALFGQGSLMVIAGVGRGENESIRKGLSELVSLPAGRWSIVIAKQFLSSLTFRIHEMIAGRS